MAPIITGSTSREELEAAAVRYGWTRRTLTAKEIREMSSGETRYHSVCNPEQFDAAMKRDEISKHNDREMEKVAANRIWDDKATPAETEAAMKEVAKFTAAYPQFRGADKENRDKLLQYLRERSEVITYTTLVAAFEALALLGAISLNPSAISAGSENFVAGKDLTRHHSFHLLLQRQNRTSEVDNQSADQYLEANKDVLADRRTPPLMSARMAKAAATERYLTRTDANTAKSGSTTVVDYPSADQTGYPAAPTKYSFKRLLDSLSADEFNRRITEDKVFAAAVDKMDNDGNR